MRFQIDADQVALSSNQLIGPSSNQIASSQYQIVSVSKNFQNFIQRNFYLPL